MQTEFYVLVFISGLSQTSNGVSLIPLYPDQVAWLPRATFTRAEVTAATWKIQTAAHLNVVLNSRFCTPVYVSKLTEARQQATILKKENSDSLEKILDKVNPRHIVDMLKGGKAEVRNLDNLVSFTKMMRNENFGIVLNVGSGLDYLTHYLQERNAKFNSIRISVLTENGKAVLTIDQETACQVKQVSQNVRRLSQMSDCQKINLVFTDLDNSDELLSRGDFLSLCVIALKLLETGGMFVCRVCETLTRFNVGILYILHQLFDELTIVKPVLSRLSNPQRYLVCKGFHSDDNHFVGYLENILDCLVKLDCEKSALDVVEIAPMGLLYSDQFYSFVKKINEQLAHLELQSIVHLESLYLCPGKMPSSEDISKLGEEVMVYLK